MPMYKVKPLHGAPGALRAEQLPSCMYRLPCLHRAAPPAQVGAAPPPHGSPHARLGRGPAGLSRAAPRLRLSFWGLFRFWGSFSPFLGSSLLLFVFFFISFSLGLVGPVLSGRAWPRPLCGARPSGSRGAEPWEGPRQRPAWPGTPLGMGPPGPRRPLREELPPNLESTSPLV